MDLIINNKIIEAPITDILYALKVESENKYFNYIGKDGFSNVRVQCCWHKGGQETKPSAAVFNETNDPEVEYGFFKCFTCGKKAPLYTVVAHCLEINEEEAKDWLVTNFGSLVPVDRQLQAFELTKKKKAEKIILDENILNDYNYFHPYIIQRKLSPEVTSKYKVGYDPESDSITFPCWDFTGNLVAINRRSVKGKNFKLVQDVSKEIYLLNYAIAEHANCVFVTESQINSLYIMSIIPDSHAVALLGTGSKAQYQILKKAGIRSFILVLDGDSAGRIGTVRFIKALGSESTISIKDIPEGKDANDLSPDEFINCPILSTTDWLNKYNMKLS